MIELEKIYTSIIENPYNLNANWMIEILLVLYIAHMILMDQYRIELYINNYID